MGGTETPGWKAYSSRSDLEKYGDNALLLFVAELRLNLDDIDAFATNALTDGSNDKKCDLVAVVNSGQKIVVAQGYYSRSPSKSEAPASKASDLNTGVSWLLSGDLSDLPETLRSAALEVRAALDSGSVTEFQVWYVHNLPESQNVQKELNQVSSTADGILRRQFPDSSVNVTVSEIGYTSVEDEYKKTQAPILITNDFTFGIPGGFEMTGKGWASYSTAISGFQLRELWQAHKSSIMSPNIRGYLGVVKSTSNINNGIKETAKNQPENFAIFNNGITVLVHDYTVESDGVGSSSLHVSGVGIVNGGQTTGAIGELSDGAAEKLKNAQVMARFVKCTDTDILGNIVRYNNTQNKVEAADFRSNDPIQHKLRHEFASIPDAEYRGGKRGGTSDAIVRMKSLLPDSSVAQCLAAFHGEPNLAYNETRSIWDRDNVYTQVFRQDLTARHVVFAYGLFKAVENAKLEISQVKPGDRTENQKKHASFFSTRGSNLLLVAAIASNIETLLGRPIIETYTLQFIENVSPSTACDMWRPVVDVLLSFTSFLSDATNQGLKNKDKVKDAFGKFSSMVEATRSMNSSPFDAFALQVS